jgi:hypothetical protein
MIAIGGSGPAASLARYEKLFRRIDTDGDGMLTMKEFKIALKGLQYKQEKEWNLRMIRRLFDLCDRNRDGFLSIQEFNNYILEQQLPDNYKFVKVETDAKGDDEGHLTVNFSDNEEKGEDQFGVGGRRAKALTDDEIMKKVYQILEDIVPNESDGGSTSHREIILSSVKRFFQRAG